MIMNINTNLESLKYAKGLNSNSQVKESDKLSSGNNVNTNGANLEKNNKDSQKISVTATRDTSTQQITNGQTSYTNSMNTAKSKLEDDYMNMRKIGEIVNKMYDIAQKFGSGSVTGEEGKKLNSEFNDLRKEMDTTAKEFFGDVDSNNKNNINLSYRDNFSKESKINISFEATTAGLGLDSDSIDFSNQHNAMRSMKKIQHASMSIDHTEMGIEHGMRQIDQDQRMKPLESISGISNSNRMRDIDISSKNYNILRQASASQLAQANQAPAAVLKLL